MALIPAVTTSAQDVAVDFGPPYGVWMLQDLDAWKPVNEQSPEVMVTGDLDGTGLDDLVMDFGSGIGVYAWMNDATWRFIHPVSPSRMAVGDFDNTGQDDVVFDFPGYGLWRFDNNSTWAPLHGLSATHLAVGNLDGTGGDELLVSFAEAGLWRYGESSGWTFLHGFPTTQLLTADLDNNGAEDVLVAFLGLGLSSYLNDTTWMPLHPFATSHIAAGNVDDNNAADLVIDFGAGIGIYLLRNGTTWTPLHALASEGLIMADVDGNGIDEIGIDFGPGIGLWARVNDSSWKLVHGLSPETMTAGQLDFIPSTPGDVPNPDEPTTLKLSRLARHGEDLTITHGQVVEIDSSRIDVGVLRVDGTLRCPNEGNYQLHTTGIVVSGSFACGTSRRPFAGSLDIVLEPGHDLDHMGERAFLVVSGGEVSLFGESRKSRWHHLGRTAHGGTSRIVLDENATGWEAGDEIVVASSSFDPHQSERAKVRNINGKVVTLEKPLKYRHWGTVESIQVESRQWVLDERAEVANLTRNIRIHPSGNEASHNKIGAHMMVMSGGAAYIDSVEFTNMGQMGILGRYPFHWHRAGNVDGQFIVNSSIHDTYQRCVTVHGTQYARIRNNVCYNHFGHGFFLEHGNEIRNQLIGNLGLLTKKVPQGRELLISDVAGARDRFAAPATFWISNPDNRVVGNVAAGSEGSGFWMSFSRSLFCTPASCTVDSSDRANVFPIREHTWEFASNAAHSNTIGMTWDGAADGSLRDNPRNPNDRELTFAHYAPVDMPIFEELVAYKNAEVGLYFRGAASEFRHSVTADNGWSHLHAFNQVISDSLVVGTSANHSDTEIDYLIDAVNKYHPFIGVVVYDGPFELHNVDFDGFSRDRVLYRGRDVTSTPISNIGGATRHTNTVKGLAFSREPFRRFFFSPDNWKDSPWSLSVMDLDGSLTGTSRSLVVPNHPFVDHPSCQTVGTWNALVCHYSIGLFSFGGHDLDYVPFKATRSDGPATMHDRVESSDEHLNKFAMILNEGYEYTVDFTPHFQASATVTVTFAASTTGALSSVVHLRDVGSNCRVRGAQQLSSLDALRRASSSSFFRSGRDLSVRLEAAFPHPNGRGAVGSHGWSGVLALRCD